MRVNLVVAPNQIQKYDNAQAQLFAGRFVRKETRPEGGRASGVGEACA